MLGCIQPVELGRRQWEQPAVIGSEVASGRPPSDGAVLLQLAVAKRLPANLWPRL